MPETLGRFGQDWRLAVTDSGGFAVGRLSLLAPVVDVPLLLDGEIGG